MSMDGHIAGPGDEVDVFPTPEPYLAYLTGDAGLAGAVYGGIDEVILKLYPVMLGKGVPMVSAGFDVTSFERADLEALDTGHVILRYIRS